jgi:hypothetical protein
MLCSKQWLSNDPLWDDRIVYSFDGESFLLTYVRTYSLTHSLTHSMVQDIVWNAGCHSACKNYPTFFM